MKQQLPKPNNPNFSSGPCRKHPGWSLSQLENGFLGRSHRAKEGKAKLKQVITLSKEILGIPDDYLVGIIPASNTGAVETAMWSLLGVQTVDVFSWEAFSNTWLSEIASQLNLPHNSHHANYGDLPDLSRYDLNHDTVFVYNGTTSGVKVPNLDWISSQRTGITICDATSAVFSQDIDFNKLDVTTWSWQKSLGGEGAHGMIALSPKAIERLENYEPRWPIPKIFTLAKNKKVISGIFEGETINTPSMLCVEDVLSSLNWLRSIGGQSAAKKISDTSLSLIQTWVKSTPWIDFLCSDVSNLSNTSVCLNIIDNDFNQLDDTQKVEFLASLSAYLAAEKVAYDIKSYKSAPLGLRIWTGATVSPKDVEKLLPWLDNAFYQTKAVFIS